ncbi:MAG TPA: (d)CMP kinase [Gemmatimonadaceae bacterium]|nr:(d)CMP kinase [Gemmatimonadaceae bacterium]
MSAAEPGPRDLIVAIDGPAAAGKSSTAKLVATRLGIRHADSGALYRAVTAARLRHPGEPATWTEESVLSAASAVSLARSVTSFEVQLDGVPGAGALHTAAVTTHVSLVARMPGVRAWVNARMLECARSGSIVVDGRDMGTAVFPGAPLKIFLIADSWERARRRLMQRLGRPPSEDEAAAETEALVRRDAKDATQSHPAPDAILIDTTYLTQEEQVERIVALAKAVRD